MEPSELLADPKKVYFLVSTCEACGQRVRASAALRHWSLRPDPHINDAEMMTTRGGGQGLILNQRAPLWSELARNRDPALHAAVGCYMGMLESRLRRFASELAEMAVVSG